MKEKQELESVVSDVVGLLEQARRASVRSVNSILTKTYWEIGRRIVEEEQRGGARAQHYGEEVVEALAAALSARFGRGFRRSNLFLMRAFFLAYQGRGEIVQAVPAQSPEKGRSPAKSTGSEIVQAAPGQSFAPSFPLPWTHYVELLSLDRPEARTFYETEALRGGWSYRQLHRQIATHFFERTVLKRKVAVPKLPPEGPASVEEEVKDPYVLEFLGLKDEYSESDLEDALIQHLESFLLELGGDFAFVARQRNCRIGEEYRTVLPDEQRLVDELNKTRRLLEARRSRAK